MTHFIIFMAGFSVGALAGIFCMALMVGRKSDED